MLKIIQSYFKKLQKENAFVASLERQLEHPSKTKLRFFKLVIFSILITKSSCQRWYEEWTDLSNALVVDCQLFYSIRENTWNKFIKNGGYDPCRRRDFKLGCSYLLNNGYSRDLFQLLWIKLMRLAFLNCSLKWGIKSDVCHREMPRNSLYFGSR